MTIDINKKYKTREGKEARILATDGPGKWPVVGIVGELVRRWAPDGSHPSGPGHDLVEAPKEYFRTIRTAEVHLGVTDWRNADLRVGGLVDSTKEGLRKKLCGADTHYQYVAVFNEAGRIIRIEEF